MGKGKGCGSSKPVVVSDDKVTRNESGPAVMDGPSVAAAVVIQRWFKGYRARLEIRRKLSWQVFTDIEYQSEVEQLGLSDFFSDLEALKDALTEHQAEQLRRRNTGSLTGDSDHLNEGGRVRRTSSRTYILSPESSMTTETEDVLLSRPNAPSGVSLEMVEEMINDSSNGSTLPSSLLMSLLDEAFVLQKTFGNIRACSSRVAHRVTVVGDLHGHLHDLSTIFQMNGIPNDGNPYVFNGDLVDRGSGGIEIVAITFAFQLLYPHAVFVNRGNHEDYLMNKRYGFEKEVMEKYPQQVASKLMRAIGALFAALPLVTVIDSYALVIHAGISENMDLDKLAEVERQHFVSILRAAKKAKEKKGGQDDSKTSLIINAVWSDPGVESGSSFNDIRGGGSIFGPDITSSFLKKYGLSLLVRSHECKRLGFEWTHGKQVLTLFSASNYYANGTNLGAFAVFETEPLKSQVDKHPRIVQFDASDGALNGQLKLSEQVSAIERAAYHDVMKQVAQKKDHIVELYKSCSKVDGKITVSQWVEIMREGTKLSIPWRMMKNTFVTPDEHGMIDFETFVHAFKVTSEAISNGPQSSAVQTIAQKLYQNLGALEYIFRLIDEDNSGNLSHDEFVMACQALTKHIGGDGIDEESARAMANTIDLDHNGKIEFNEFVESFRLIKT